MKLAFYIAKYGNEIDKMISFFTHGPYSHVELVFDDTDATKAQGFSASPSEGVRFKAIDLTQPCWKIVPVSATPDQTAKCYTDAKALVSSHVHYDWLAIVGFVIPLDEHSGDMCSEVDDKILQDAGIGKVREPWELSPNELFHIVTK